MMKCLKFCLIYSFLLAFMPLHASDTLHINLYRADSIFIAKNYYLLASGMNIEASKAALLQSKLYPNPVFTADLNAYDPQNQRPFHLGSTGQMSFQLEQLILLGGKRKAEIEMARTNVLIAELEFNELVRQLKFRLHTGLFNIGAQQELLAIYNGQLNLLDSIMVAYEVQVNKGNIPLKDLVRLQSVYLHLNNSKADVLKEFYTSQAELQQLLQTTDVIVFDHGKEDVTAYIKNYSLEYLKEEALGNNPSVQLMEQSDILAEEYLKFQKRMAVPDLRLFTSYDQRGGAFNNQVNIGFSMDLPLWNQNRGNIKAAGFRIKETEFYLHALRIQVVTELQNYYAFYTRNVEDYTRSFILYDSDFEITLKGMSDNFQKDNISLIEFVDFFEAYNQALTELSRVKMQLVISAEQMNLSIGKDLY